MDKIYQKLQTLINLMGFNDFSINTVEESKRLNIFINDVNFVPGQLSQFVSDLEYLIKMIAKKEGVDMVFIDINNHRKEREDLIIKLAKASAKKAVVTKLEIILPPMNAFERRLVHAELAVNPDIKTESTGEGKERRVVIKPIL